MNPDRDFLLDIIEFIETIERNRPLVFEDFMEDGVVRSATIYWVQTIGEAANGISEELRSKHPDVPWRQMLTCEISWHTDIAMSILRSCGRLLSGISRS